MLTAKSMYHGGELVSAIDVNVDFDSYKTLGLLCPFCNEPVFLCGETVRQSSRTKKLSYIQPHFKHFPGGDPMDFDCEKRSISSEGKRYLDAIRAERRGQRLELFNRYFDDITTFGFRAKKWQQYWGSVPPPAPAVYTHQQVSQWWTQNATGLIASSASLVDYTLSLSPPTTFDKSEDLFWSRLQDLKTTIDKNIHKLIVAEAIEFLTTRKAFCHLANLHFIVASHFFYSESSKEYEDPVSILSRMVEQLVLINWQKQVEEKSKLTCTKGFAKAF